MPQFSYSRPKAIWTPELHKLFVDLCVEQTVQGNKPRTYFTRAAWKNILESFNIKTGSRYDRLQLKNRWDYMCKQWKAWSKLIESSTMKWDSETNTFGASDEDWANYLQVNPDAAQFRFNPPAHSDKLEIIFAGHDNIDDGVRETPRARKRVISDRTSYARITRSRANRDTGVSAERSIYNSGLRYSKANWTPSLHELFIDLCVRETLRGNKPGTHFTKAGWKNIVASFNEKTTAGYDRIQLKNHWDGMKKQWKIWSKLVATSNMKWDSYSHSFDASSEAWANYIHENPEAAQFRYEQIPHVDKLNIIFSGETSTGETDPSSWHGRPNVHAVPLDVHVTEPLSVVYAKEPTSDLNVNEPAQVSPSVETACRFDAIESRSGGSAHKSPVAVHSAPVKLSYSIGECIECLDGMEEVEQGSDLYLFALDIFLKKEYREIFLQLKKPGLRIAWLQRLQSVSPTLS